MVKFIGFLLICLAFADIEEDLYRVNSLSNTLDTLTRIVRDTDLGRIKEYLTLLEKEVEKAEKSIENLVSVIDNLSQSHANFNTTEAGIVQNMVLKIQSLVNLIDLEIHRINTTNIKKQIPQAIVGLSTMDSQATNSISKIRQESEKLVSYIVKDSKFYWVWGILALLSILIFLVLITISKASAANI